MDGGVGIYDKDQLIPRHETINKKIFLLNTSVGFLPNAILTLTTFDDDQSIV